MKDNTHVMKMYCCLAVTVILTGASYAQLTVLQHRQQAELDARKLLIVDFEKRLSNLESK